MNTLNQKLPADKVQNNFKSIRHDGLLVDINNINKLVVNNQTLLLKTHYSGDIIISEYSSNQDAEEDMALYQSVLQNPKAKVINIRVDGRFAVFGDNSPAYKELQMRFSCTSTDY